ncbi:MAG: hypothetical protein ABIF40_04070 [archaeon]
MNIFNHPKFVKLYAEKLEKDPSLFAIQKVLIDTEIKTKNEIARKIFGSGEEFKKNVRKFYKENNLL